MMETLLNSKRFKEIPPRKVRRDFAVEAMEEMGRSNRKGKTNTELLKTIEELRRVSRENNAPVWRAVARRLEGPLRNWAEVNLDHASACVKEDEVGVVPGKVLGDGTARKGLRLAAFRFTKSAREKLAASGGAAMALTELAESNPRGSRVVILG